LNTKGTKTLRIKKKAPPVRTGKPPAQGERKAMRKRIVLSNTNALEVKGLRDLNEDVVAEMVVNTEHLGQNSGLASISANGSGVVGQVVGLQGATVDSLRASEAFKITQGWGLFRRPGLLLRQDGVSLSRRMVQAQTDKSAIRMVIDGERGTGKSLMLLHAMATGFVKGWVVLNIPEGIFSFFMAL
jgi:small subunit ribosomal protein S29